MMCHLNHATSRKPQREVIGLKGRRILSSLVESTSINLGSSSLEESSFLMKTVNGGAPVVVGAWESHAQGEGVQDIGIWE